MNGFSNGITNSKYLVHSEHSALKLSKLKEIIGFWEGVSWLFQDQFYILFCNVFSVDTAISLNIKKKQMIFFYNCQQF